MYIAGVAMLAIYFGGTVGYFLLGGGDWSVGDCAYMTVISLTTVGYGEVLRGIDHVPYARLFTATLLVLGAGVVLYFLSVLTTYLVEGEFLDLRRKRKMRKMIDKLSEHIIVCGAGRTGGHIVHELCEARWPFVVIDNDVERINRCQDAEDVSIDHIIDDATDDAVLLSAGIEKAAGIVAALPQDKDNLYVVLTARGLNQKLRIVTKAVDFRAAPKLRAAGADSVVNVNQIGGLRLASEMIRPQVVTFLDKMVRDKDKTLRFEELTIGGGSPLVGKQLASADLREARNLLIVAAYDAQGAYTYSPGPKFVLEEAMTLIVLGETDAVE